MLYRSPTSPTVPLATGVHVLDAAELVTAFARLDGRAVGIVGVSPRSAAERFSSTPPTRARFIELCDAYNVPILFFCDTSGFMVGRAVEHAGIIRHGAKMISAMAAAAEVPRFCIVVRKAYGAGYYAMSSPGFQPRATLALPTARISGMSPSAAVNAVYVKHIAALGESERAAFLEKKTAEYDETLGLDRLASGLFVDAVVEFNDLRQDLANRLASAAGWRRRPNDRHIRVSPV